jgi:WD40 repeat protein
VKKPQLLFVVTLLLSVGRLSLAQTQEPAYFPLPELEVISPENANRVTFLGELEGFSWWTLFAAFSPDGEIVAASSAYGGVRVWDVKTGQPLKSLECPVDELEGWTGGVAFTPDGSLLAVGCGLSVRVWSIDNILEEKQPELTSILSGPISLVGKVVIGSTGQYLAANYIGSGDDPKFVWLWDMQTGKQLATFEGVELCCPYFSPDGQSLAYTDDKETHIWDIKALQEVDTYTYRSQAFSLDWTLAADTSDGLHLWDILSDTAPFVLHNIDNHSPKILAFSPDISLLASGSEHYNMLLWDTVSHERLAVIDTAGITDLTFSPDGKLIVTTHATAGGPQGQVTLWGVVAEE